MGKFGKIIATIAAVLKTGVRLAGEMSLDVIEGVAKMVAGMLRRRPAVEEEVVEDRDHVTEDLAGRIVDKAKAAAVEEEAKAAPARKVTSGGGSAPAAQRTVGELMHQACRSLEEGKATGRPFQGWKNEISLMLYLGSLSTIDRQTILAHSPSSITRHFREEGFRATGVPSWSAFDPEAEYERQRTKGWTTIDFYEDIRARLVADGDEEAVDWDEVWDEAERLAGESPFLDAA
ncbi:hypothetical protein [Jiella sp. M17.18]|uniref:hypothetical protein n=1 Tax=Jiella sp. M17.18 TaxID=3234247 RepID=UPI0034DFB21B